MEHISVFMFDLRMISLSSECEYDWYLKILARSTEYEMCGSFPSLTRQQTSYYSSVKHHSDSTKKFSKTDIINMLEFLIDNIFAMFGGRIFQHA
jgi:hypothetical protein